jgi:hypothetical protein
MATFRQGEAVLGHYRGGRFLFPGVVESVRGDEVAVLYDDGERETLPAAAVRPFDWRAGTMIEALWSDDGKWYSATLIDIGPGDRLTIRFDDGIVEETKRGRCRCYAATASLEPGQWVLGRWRAGGHWFPAQVEEASGGVARLAYADGDREALPVDLVKPFDWRVGSRIDATWSGDGKWYAATITEVEPGDTTLTVRFDDGIVERTDIGRCRSE